MSRYRTSTGFTLVELVVFIVIAGVIATGIFTAFPEALRASAKPTLMTRALALSQERTELILAQRRNVGFTNFTALTFDPCKITPLSTVPACTVPSGYTMTTVLATNWSGDVNYKIITVTVDGQARAQLQALVANY